MADKNWRIGKRNGGNGFWQIKEPPSWRVAHQCQTLHEAAAWLTERGINIATVHVVDQWPWRTLEEWTQGEKSEEPKP